MKKIYVLLLLLVLGMYEEPVLALEDNQSQVTLSFNLTVKDYFTYEVVVGKGGSVKEGGARIRDGTLVYEMYVGERKSFVIEPDFGYQIKSIECDRELEIEGNRVTIHQVSSNSVLKVSFEKITGGNIPDEGKPDEGKPNEGGNDSSNKGEVVVADSNIISDRNKHNKNKLNSDTSKMVTSSEIPKEGPLSRSERVPNFPTAKRYSKEGKGNGIDISYYVLPVLVGGLGVIWILISKKRNKEKQ